MALSTNCTWELRPGSGASTNAGGFDPSQTAGMLTDGAATSATGNAPVFTSASYNFVAGDVGAFIYIASGTNWVPGWYKISSVATNAATLDATLGHVNLVNGDLSTAAGCATTGSPTSATWSVDYSQQNSAQVSFTDLVIGATTTNLTSALNPFGKQWVGNIINITSGTGFTTGRYCVTSVATVTATMDRSVGTAASASGNGKLGGGLASWADTFLTTSSGTPLVQGGMRVWVTGTQTVTVNIAIYSVGTASGNGARTLVQGYGTYRGDSTHALLQTATNNVIPLYCQGVSEIEFCQIDFKSTAGTPSSGFYFNNANSSYVTLRRCKISGVTIGIDGATSTYCQNLYCFEVEVTGCSSHGISNLANTFLFGCYFHGNTGDGIHVQNNAGACIHIEGCVSYSNTGIGINDASSGSNRFVNLINNTVHSNTSDGVKMASGSGVQLGVLINNIAYNNGGYGFNFPSISSSLLAPLTVGYQRDNAFGANSSGARSVTAPGSAGDVTLTADPCTAPASGDFTLNTTAGGGAACKGSGWQSSII